MRDNKLFSKERLTAEFNGIFSANVAYRSANQTLKVSNVCNVCKREKEITFYGKFKYQTFVIK